MVVVASAVYVSILTLKNDGTDNIVTTLLLHTTYCCECGQHINKFAKDRQQNVTNYETNHQYSIQRNNKIDCLMLQNKHTEHENAYYPGAEAHSGHPL